MNRSKLTKPRVKGDVVICILIFCICIMGFISFGQNPESSQNEVRMKRYFAVMNAAPVPDVIAPPEPAKNIIFIPINATNTTTTVSWVCISNTEHQAQYRTEHEKGWKWFFRDSWVDMPPRDCDIIPQKRITIHGNLSQPRATKLHGFSVSYTQRRLPVGFKLIEDRVAYFHGMTKFPFRPYNFYHFILQDFFPLHHLINSTGRLNETNDVFFPGPAGFCPGRFIPYDLTGMMLYFKMLGVQNVSRSIYQDNPYPDRVCYKHAVFNSKLHLKSALDATDYIKRQLNVTDNCQYDNMVTIVQRASLRKILNIEEIKEVTKQMGYNLTVVYMEKLSYAEQAQLIHCTRVLIGLQGAALTWANFMKNYSGFIEIAWPKKEWPFFFTSHKGYKTDLNGLRPLNISQLSVDNCEMDARNLNKYYESMFFVKSNISIDDAFDILRDKRNFNFTKNYIMSIGKLCNVKIPRNKFRDALQQIRTYKTKFLY